MECCGRRGCEGVRQARCSRQQRGNWAQQASARDQPRGLACGHAHQSRRRLSWDPNRRGSDASHALAAAPRTGIHHQSVLNSGLGRHGGDGAVQRKQRRRTAADQVCRAGMRGKRLRGSGQFSSPRVHLDADGPVGGQANGDRRGQRGRDPQLADGAAPAWTHGNG